MSKKIGDVDFLVKDFRLSGVCTLADQSSLPMAILKVIRFKMGSHSIRGYGSSPPRSNGQIQRRQAEMSTLFLRPFSS
jgi:hypothetical protein